jgi:hypothetical protein
MTRAVSILLGTGVAGVLIWTTAQVHRGSTGGYWGEVALLAAAGLILGLSRLVDRRAGRRLVLSAPTFVIAFLPALVVAGWIIVAGQPNGSWLHDHVMTWSGDIDVSRVVSDTTAFAAVLAFGLGVLLSLVAERRATAVTESVPPIETTEPAPAPSPIDDGDRSPELVTHGDGS